MRVGGDDTEWRLITFWILFILNRFRILISRYIRLLSDVFYLIQRQHFIVVFIFKKVNGGEGGGMHPLPWSLPHINKAHPFTSISSSFLMTVSEEGALEAV